MSLKKSLLGIAAAVTMGVAAHSAQAATICSGCDYVDGAVGTYLGAHNATTNDFSSFRHDPPPFLGDPFINFWVFDVAPDALGSASANFTVLAPLANFRGALHFDDGSVCAGGPGTGCASIGIGALIASNAGDAWGIVFGVAPGRYVLVIEGNALQDNSNYTGQLAFVARAVPEPNALLLLAVGLIAAGFTARRRSA